jgi:hypothetical protein
LYIEYDSRQDFARLFPIQFAQTVDRNYPSAVNGEKLADQVEKIVVPRMSDEAKVLLLEVSHDRNGTILRTRSSSGLCVQTNGRNLVPSRDPREEATWSGAVDELRDRGLIKDVGNKGQVFELTRTGWETVDYLSKQS